MRLTGVCAGSRTAGRRYPFRPVSIPDPQETRNPLCGSAAKWARLALHPQHCQGKPCNWPFDEADPYANDRLGETPEVQARLYHWDKDYEKILTSYGTHWVGGHPNSVQGDPRAFDPALQNLTRVLLHLGFDDDICLGDAGELNLLISQQDLQARRFDKAFCQWDCA